MMAGKYIPHGPCASAFLGLLVSALANPAASQEAARPPYCSRGAPAPECGRFLVVETGLGVRSRGARGQLGLSWQAGLLANRGRSALGATGYIAVDLDVRDDRPVHSTRFGVLPRYRKWFGRHASLDLSTGPVLEVRQNVPSTLLLSSDVAVGWPNEGALDGRLDLSAGNRPAWFVGIRLGTDQITQGLEGQGVALIVWGLVRLLTR